MSEGPLNVPYMRLLRFLVSRKSDINTVLRRMKLPPIDWAEDMALKNRLKGGALPSIVDAYFRSDSIVIDGSQAFLSWATSEEISELWTREPEFAQRNDDLQDACKTFSSPGRRTPLALLIMAGFTAEESIEIIYQKYEVRLTVATIELFKKLFWDVRLMRRQDWISLLATMEKDQRTLLSLAFAEKGRDNIKFVLGVVPEIELRDVLTNIMTKAHMRFNSMIDLPSCDDVTAISWANLAMRAGEKRKNAGGGPSRNLSDDMQMQLTNDDPVFPSLAELSAAVESATKTDGN